MQVVSQKLFRQILPKTIQNLSACAERTIVSREIITLGLEFGINYYFFYYINNTEKPGELLRKNMIFSHVKYGNTSINLLLLFVLVMTQHHRLMTFDFVGEGRGN